MLYTIKKKGRRGWQLVRVLPFDHKDPSSIPALSRFEHSCDLPKPNQPSILPGLVNKYQRLLGANYDGLVSRLGGVKKSYLLNTIETGDK